MFMIVHLSNRSTVSILDIQSYTEGHDSLLKSKSRFLIQKRIIYWSKSSTTQVDQGCALAEPGGPWRLTFALGPLENLRFFIQIICWAPWILQFQSTGPPSIFLRAQPCGFFGSSKTRYFGYMIQSISLLRIQKEQTMPVVTHWKQ